MVSILFRSFFLSFKSISRNLHGKKANRNHKEISKADQNFTFIYRKRVIFWFYTYN